MSGRYERVNAHDDEDDTPYDPRTEQIPNSPPPSFHSRSSSLTRRNQGQVDPTLADAFDDSDDDSDRSDDEADDRQRLMTQNSTPAVTLTPAETASSATSDAGATPLHTAATTGMSSGSRPRVMGGGVGSDGVFANLSARPERGGEAEKEELPPTYEQAAADSAPPYWETTILAPGMGGPDEVYIDGMPVGSVFSFIWNGMISTSFQLVGFLLTYLLHSTHAAKGGSRAGLGVTLIQYGFYMKGTTSEGPPEMSGPDGYAAPPDPNSHNFDEGDVEDGGGGPAGISSTEWLSYLLMIVGWFVLIKSIADFLKARRHEQLVLQSPDRGLGVAVIAEGEEPSRVV